MASAVVDTDVLRRLAVALAVGLLLGLERERSHRPGEPQAAGSRTFALLAVAGAVAAAIDAVVVAAGAVAAAALLAIGYARTSELDRGATTEVAGVVTYLLGALSWRYPQPAVAAAVGVAVLLASKAPLHRFARDVITETEVEDALRFFVVAFVVLPVLPDRRLGPYGVLNPSRIWLLIVALTGIGWAGYVAVRALGPRRGLLVAGFAGGFISASATTGSMGRVARQCPAVVGSAVGGALLASLATVVELIAITWIANADLLRRLLPALLAGGITIVVEATLLYRRHRAASNTAAESVPVGPAAARPFALWPAVVLAGVLTAVLLVARWGSNVLGSGGAVATAAIAGLADVHAAVLAVATLSAAAALGTRSALIACGLALATNTATKATLALIGGGRAYAARFVGLMVAPSVAFATVLVATLP